MGAHTQVCRVLGEAAGMGSIERFIDSKEGRDGGGEKRGERGVTGGCHMGAWGE